LSSFPKGGADIETIAKIVQGVTAIDRIHHIGCDVPRTNPIIGSFKRFQQQDAPYAGDVSAAVSTRAPFLLRACARVPVPKLRRRRRQLFSQQRRKGGPR
jgi:hypothetical protein